MPSSDPVPRRYPTKRIPGAISRDTKPTESRKPFPSVLVAGYIHLQDFPHSRRRAESKIRDIKFPVWPKRHCRRKTQTRRNRRHSSPAIESDNGARPQLRGTGKAWHGHGFENVAPATFIIGDALHISESARDTVVVAIRFQLVNVLSSWDDGKFSQGTEDEFAVMGDDGGWANPHRVPAMPALRKASTFD